MAFLPILNNALTQVEGAIGCAVMGFDGIMLESVYASHAPSTLDFTGVFVEFAQVLATTKKVGSSLGLGPTTELCVSSEKVMTLMHLVNSEYCVILALNPSANLGKARFVLRTTVPRLRESL